MKNPIFSGVRTALLLTAMTVLAGGVSLQADDSKLLNKDELKHLVSTAKTAQDHQRLAAHFNAKADQLDAEAKEHTELAAQYKSHPTIHEMKHQMSGQTAGHCDYFAASMHKAALDARRLAADHEEMAKEASATQK
jgi:hypothetical protein